MMSRHAVFALILILAAGPAVGQAKVNRFMIERVASGKAQIAVASWWGFDSEDSTEALQTAIDSGARKVIVDDVRKPWIVRPITLRSDQEIIFRRGVEVVAKRGEFKGATDALFRADNESNITLNGYGAVLRMHRADYAAPPYEDAEWRHVLSLKSCSNVRVYGLALVDGGGDGIYLGVATRGATNSNVHIKDVVCDRNYRQGISVISADRLLIEGTVMRDTGGTPPQAGIDFEPNRPDERLSNIVMRNCTAEFNRGDGYEFYFMHLDASSAPVSMRFENCRSLGDGQQAVRLVTGNTPASAVKGRIEFADCAFADSVNGGILISNLPVGGCRVVFSRCSLANPAVEKPTVAPILFQSRQDASEPIGGVEFDNLLLSDPVLRNPIGYADGGGGIPVRAVTGVIDLQRGGERQTIELTPEKLIEWIPASAIKQIPRLSLEGLSLKPQILDADPDAYAFGFARMRREGRLVLYAREGDAVSIRLAHDAVGRLAGSAIQVRITDPSSVSIDAPAVPFRGECEVSFTAPETGVYRVVADPGGNSVRVVASSHPVNIVGEGGPVRLIYSAGDYFFRVPAGVREFGVRVCGEGTGEAIRAVLINPDGRVVQEVDNAVQTHQFEVALPAASRGEIWMLRLAKPSAMAWEDHSIDLRGIPPLLAPSPEALLVNK